jgi:hypothetical protein
MNETEIAVMSGLAKIREAGARVVPMEVTKLEELYSENARLREALVALLDDAEVQDFGEWFEDRLKQAREALEVKPIGKAQ